MAVAVARAGLYTPQEVEWLISISHGDAVSVDAAVQSSWPDRKNPAGVIGPEDAHELLTVLRWDDVDIARRRVQNRIDQKVTVLRRMGLDQAQIGRIVGRHQSVVSRRFRASIDDIVGELSGNGRA